MKPSFFITIISLLLFNSCFLKENLYDENIIDEIGDKWNERISDGIIRRSYSEKSAMFSLFKKDLEDVEFFITRHESIGKAKEQLFQSNLRRSVNNLQEVKSTPFDKTFLQYLNGPNGRRLEIVAHKKNVNIRIITNSKPHANKMIGVLLNTFEENLLTEKEEEG